IELLGRHRGGLDAVARGLLERETLDGEEVGRLVDTAYGGPVHDAASAVVPHFAPTEDPPAGVDAPPSNGGYVEATPSAKPTGATD
ncbi:MAG: hypothetical protein ACRDY1_14255, partial [Acidimicrobiales bacterium]